MTRDEAILLYTGKVKMISRIIDSRELGCNELETLNWWECQLTKHEELIEALKGPQPDAETGLMPCGCGGKAECCGNSGDYDSYSFECIKCETGTLSLNPKEDAKIAWNRAMGCFPPLLEAYE